MASFSVGGEGKSDPIRLWEEAKGPAEATKPADQRRECQRETCRTVRSGKGLRDNERAN